MRTELHHHHQVPTCGIKHQVLHRTHLKKKKVISRFISEILPYCVQNMLVSSDHPTSFCAAATQLWKDTRSLSVFQGCHYSPSLHLPKRHINNFNREKTMQTIYNIYIWQSRTKLTYYILYPSPVESLQQTLFLVISTFPKVYIDMFTYSYYFIISCINCIWLISHQSLLHVYCFAINKELRHFG